MNHENNPDLIGMAHALGSAIQNSEEFRNYEELRAKQDMDSELQMYVGEYNLKRMALMNEMQKEEDQQDEATVRRLREEMNAAYVTVSENPLMKDFLSAKETAEKMVSDVYAVLNFYITGEESGGCDGTHCEGCHGCH